MNPLDRATDAPRDCLADAKRLTRSDLRRRKVCMMKRDKGRQLVFTHGNQVLSVLRGCKGAQLNPDLARAASEDFAQLIGHALSQMSAVARNRAYSAVRTRLRFSAVSCRTPALS